jgi:hypothetical protein
MATNDFVHDAARDQITRRNKTCGYRLADIDTHNYTTICHTQ